MRERKREAFFFVHLFCLDLPRFGWCLYWVRVDLPYSVHTNLFQKHVLPAIWVSFSTAKLTTKIKHHCPHAQTAMCLYLELMQRRASLQCPRVSTTLSRSLVAHGWPPQARLCLRNARDFYLLPRSKIQMAVKNSDCKGSKSMFTNTFTAALPPVLKLETA
jgi:hypothetical protein